VAVTDLGLSPNEFWGLTWYEWGMYVIKLYKDQKRKLDDRELYLDVERQKIAHFMNANFRTASGGPLNLKPYDIWKLSYDTEMKKEDDPDLLNRLKKKYGDKL
jgi:hypothetical protein